MPAECSQLREGNEMRIQSTNQNNYQNRNVAFKENFHSVVKALPCPTRKTACPNALIIAKQIFLGLVPNEPIVFYRSVSNKLELFSLDAKTRAEVNEARTERDLIAILKRVRESKKTKHVKIKPGQICLEAESLVLADRYGWNKITN